MSEEALFELALRTPETERAALLDRACEDKPELRKRVEALLEADEGPAQILRQPPRLDATSEIGATVSYSAEDVTGVVIGGRYKLFEEIGEGGMGTVWLAQQSEPVKRLVAIKLIKAGMDSKAVLVRFEAERQALAMMDHPNIAKVLDGGLTEDRRPYFVMELVKGTPITKFCDERKLSLQERLLLFVPVCQAIQHAHQKGVIHRDIKPSNVLIALYDDKPVPKVIDFGVAKATGAQLTEQTLNTGFGNIVGTPEYMSPEQASMNNLDIDTRSDVYALGVLLYELLTGTTPVDKKSLDKAAMLEVLRIVREVEATRPSTKLSNSEALPSIAANRHIEPAKLSKMMKGELDWIVMKALEKDRARRYETANVFAADVQRYLSGEAVLAVPPSAGYRFQKFMKKNKGSVLTASLVFLALLGGMLGTTLGLFEAKRQEKLANKAREAEVERAEGERLAKLDAVAQKEQAQKRLSQIEKANEILGSIFANLDPQEIARAELPLQAILVNKLDKAVAQLEGDSIGDPLVVAAMQAKFGISLIGLGEPVKAEVILEKARATFQAKLGLYHPDTLSCMNNLAVAYHFAGKSNQALSLCEETLKLRKATLGPDHSDTIESMVNLGSELCNAGKLDQAIAIQEEVRKLSKSKLDPQQLDTLSNMNNLALSYQKAGKPELALPILEETLQIRKVKLGANHPDTLVSMGNLAQAYQAAKKWAQAEPLFEESLRLRKAKLGPNHTDTLIAMNNLATIYQALEKPELAQPLHEEALKVRMVKFGRDHPDTLASMGNLALTYQTAGKLAQAIPLHEETLKLRRVKLGSDHPHTIINMGNLGLAYALAGQGEKAATQLKEYITAERKQQRTNSPRFTAIEAQVALDLSKCGQYLAAEEMLRECLAIREKKEPDDWRMFNTQSLLGGALLGQKRYAEAEPLLLKGYEGVKQREKSIPPQANTRLPEALDRLIQLYTETNKPEEAKKWQTEREKLSKPQPAKK